ncbi:MAG TPA: type II toxin-antitoxin system VapC family toxin [Blastocatellia bacterium]|nr:type II toxin-antitoxin system VapC family toxin [Blastocatellia bacterium]
MNQLYLLDTNILVHLVRNDATGQHLKQTYDLLTTDPRPLLSGVTEGELRSLAHQWKWGEPKCEQMRFFLSFFWQVPIEAPEIYEAYAMMDAWCEARGISMGKNDLWIAASAHAMQAHLLTTDKDFDLLHSTFLTREFIDPSATK